MGGAPLGIELPGGYQGNIGTAVGVISLGVSGEVCAQYSFRWVFFLLF